MRTWTLTRPPWAQDLFRLARRDMRVWALAIGAVFSVLYVATAARSMQGGDSGEWMTLAAIGGVGHPPGYPLQIALMRALVWLVPFGSIAWRTSLVSALCAAWALPLLFLALRRLGVSAQASLLGVAALAVSPLYWRLATVAEVFSLAALTASALVLAVASARPGRRWPLLLGLIAASGVANHHTVILLAPLFVLGLLRSLPRLRHLGQGVQTATIFGASASLGLVAYLSLLNSAPNTLWDLHGLRDLWSHFFRQAYGTLSLSQGPAALAWWQQPWRYLATRSEDLLLFAPLALMGVVASLRTRRHRPLWGALLLSWLLLGPLLMIRFNLPLHGDGLAMSVRFYVVPDVLLLLFAARGLDSVLVRWPLHRSLSLGLALLTVTLELWLAAPRARHDQSHMVARYAEQILRHSPERAVLLGAGDSLMGAMLYAQRVQKRRSDLLFIYAGMLPAPWYRQWLMRQPGNDASLHDSQLASLRSIVDTVAGQRPLLLSPDLLDFAELSDLQTRASADGALIHVRASEETTPGIDERAARTQACIDSVLQDVDRERLMVFSDRFEGWVLEQLAAQAARIAQAYARKAQIDKAQVWAQTAAQLVPWR